MEPTTRYARGSRANPLSGPSPQFKDKFDVTGEVPDVPLWCDGARFRPARYHPVRWLDWDEDYALAASSWWGSGLTRESWLDARDGGFTYCAVVDHDQLVARAAVWKYSDGWWEVAAVWTRLDCRGRGMAKSTVSFVTEEILAADRIATLHAQPANAAMLTAARSVGFIDGEPPQNAG